MSAVRRKLSVPKEVHKVLQYQPNALVVRTLALFTAGLKIVPIEPKPGWLEITLDDAGKLAKFTDHQLVNLLMLTYLVKPPEFCYRNYVASMFADAQIEVPLSVGIVDVMTDRAVIEVKIASAWKHALGQVLAYAHVTGRAPMVALFGQIPVVARDIFLVSGIDIIHLHNL